jgi:hypothetical protein
MSTLGAGAGIVLSRDRRGPRDLLRSYAVIVDGEQVAKIRRGQRLELPVAAGRHVIFLKIDWCKSPNVEFEAQPGEKIQLTCAPGGPDINAESYIRLQRV